MNNSVRTDPIFGSCLTYSYMCSQSSMHACHRKKKWNIHRGGANSPVNENRKVYVTAYVSTYYISSMFEVINYSEISVRSQIAT